MSERIKKENVFLKKFIYFTFFIFLFSHGFAEDITVPKFVSPFEIEGVVWNKDGSSFAYKSDGKIFIRDSSTLLLTQIKTTLPPEFLSNKSQMVVEFENNTIKIKNNDNSITKTIVCPNTISCFDISEDFETLVLGTTIGKIYFYDIHSGAELGSIPNICISKVIQLDLNKSKTKLLATYNDNSFYLLQLEEALYSSSTNINLKFTDFVIPHDVIDISTLGNNNVKEFIVQKVDKNIEVPTPEFIKKEVEESETIHKFDNNNFNAETSILVEENFDQTIPEFDYTTNNNLNTKTEEIIAFKKEKNIVTSEQLITENYSISDNTKKKNENAISKKQKNPNTQNEQNISIINITEDNINDKVEKNVKIKENSPSQKTKESDIISLDSEGESLSAKQYILNQSKKIRVIDLGLIITSAQTPYVTAFGINICYKDMKILHPFVIGSAIIPSISFADSNFPYSYTTSTGQTVPVPNLLSIKLLGNIGYILNIYKDFDILFTLNMGVNISKLYNATINITSKNYCSFYTDIMTSVYYKLINVGFIVSYDAMYNFNFGGVLGFNIKLK